MATKWWQVDYKNTTQTTRSFGLVLWVVISSLLLPGCSFFVGTKAASQKFAIPKRWSTHIDSAASPVRPWLDDFNQPQLTEFVQEAFANNPNLLGLAASVEIAQQQTWIAGATRWPQLDAGIRGSRSKRSTTTGFRLSSPRTTNYGFSLDFLWEIDLWNRLGNQQEAAELDQAAAEADLKAAQLSLAANLVKTWFDATTAKQQIELASKTIQSFKNALEIIEQGYDRGLYRALDVRLARTSLLGAISREQVFRRAQDQAIRSLEFFLGRYPAGAVKLPSHLPVITEPIPTSIPAELLERRPDILAASQRFYASDQRFLEAGKNLLPSISITANGGTSTRKLGDLFNPEALIWNIASSLTQPLFHGGSLFAARNQAESSRKLAAAKYTEVLLQAFREVETTLAAEQWFTIQEKTLMEASRESREAERLAEDDYVAGLTDIATLLEAQRRAFDAENGLLDIRNQQLQNRVNLYLALGGPIQ